MLAAVVGLAVVAGGAGAAADSPLVDKTWRLTSLRGAKPVAGTTVTLAFGADGRVSGTGGCNSFGGPYTATRVRVRISSLISTQMACATGIMNQEQKYLQTLEAARLYGVRGTTLTLRSSFGRALAVFTVESQALAGTHWKVVQFNNGKQAVVGTLAGTTLTAAFGKDGMLTGSAGCNTYSATYKATTPKLAIGPAAATRKFCSTPAGVMDQESAYLAALGTVATYHIVGPRLDLLTAKGTIAVALTRS